MKINSPISASVIVKPSEINQESVGLFKDGQTILAKVVRSTTEEVVLDVSGHTIQAKLEGTAPTAGSVALFGVRFLENGRIELQIQANVQESRALSAKFFGNQLLANVLREQGLAVTSQNLRLLNQILSDCQMKYDLMPEPKLAAFLMANDLPVTAGTLLFSWLQQDGRVRDHLWNLLARSGLLDSGSMARLGDSPEMLRQFFQQLRLESSEADSEASGLLHALKRDIPENPAVSTGQNALAQEGGPGRNSFQSGPGTARVGEGLSQLINLLSRWNTASDASNEVSLLERLTALSAQSLSGLSQLAEGALVKLGLSGNGQLQLDVLAPGDLKQDLTSQALLTALRNEGLAETPANLKQLEEIITGFQKDDQLILILDPGLAAMIMAQTIGRGGNSPSHPAADHVQALVKVLLNLGEAPGESADIGLSPRPSASLPTNAMTTQTAGDDFSRESSAGKAMSRSEVLQNSEKIVELLTNGMSWKTIRDQSPAADGRWGALPFLVQDSQGLIRECVIHWQEEQGKGDQTDREQTVRLVIPTENLGDIELQLKIGALGTRIHFKVKSEAIKDYLLERESELHQATGCEAQIRVETAAQSGTSRGTLDLWL